MQIRTLLTATALMILPTVAMAQSPIEFINQERARSARGMVGFSHSFGAKASVVVAAENLLGKNPTGRRSRWCADGLSVALVRSGHRPIPGSRAVDALRAGQRISYPVPGALAVFRNRSHVAVVEKVISPGKIGLISFNWSHTTKRHTVSPRQIVAWVLPR